MANQESFPTDPAGSPEPGIGSEGVDRRRFLTYGGMAAGALAVTPTVLSLGASPAAASGLPSDQNASASNSSVVTSLTTSTMFEPVGVLVATVALQSNDQTITAPSGWTALTKAGTTGQAGAARLTTQVFWIYYATQQSDQTYTFSWATGAPAAVSITKFENAKSVVSNSGPSLSTTGTSRATGSVTPSVPGDTTPPPSILFCLGYSRVSAVPTPASPSDATNGTYTEYATARNNNVGAQQWAAYPASLTAVTPSVTSMTAGRPSVVYSLVIC